MIHIYSETTTSTQIEEVAKAFEICEHVDITNVTNVNNSDVYLVEIDKAEKAILLNIKKLLSDKKSSLVYFFTNDPHSLILFQLAILLNVKNIFIKKHDSPKIISIIKKELSSLKTTQLNTNIVENLIDEHCFMIFNSKKLVFASQKIYHDFDCKNIDDIQSKICSQLDLEKLLNSDTTIQNNFTFNKEQKTYTIQSKSSTKKDEYFIYIQNSSKTNCNDNSQVSFIKNRIYFIEILKEKILEKSISQSLLGITTIQIENMSNLKKDWNEYDIEMAIKDLLLEIEIEIQIHTLLAQYDNDLYIVLFEGLSFEDIKKQANIIKTHTQNYTNKQKIKPILGLYTFEIEELELNEILKTISKISTETITQHDIETKQLHRTMSIDEELDDSRAIDIFLQTTFTNKTPIKLLNIYKGLCINTSSMIVKKTDQEIYVTYAPLQATVMYFEKSTVMQSSNFTKDIVADVTFIDFKKKFARLKNFRFVQGNANSRKYSRVTCSQRTPITISHAGGTLSGEILDISMNSIAVRTRLYKRIDSLKSDKVTLNFTLPIKSAEDGFIKLKLTADVIFTICDEEFCKVVVNLIEDQASESVLMEYVYSRQKEVISELKKQTSMLK